MSSNSTAKKVNNINNSENYIKNFKITVFNSSKFNFKVLQFFSFHSNVVNFPIQKTHTRNVHKKFKMKAQTKRNS